VSDAGKGEAGMSGVGSVITGFVMVSMLLTAYYFLGMTWLMQPVSNMLARISSLLGS